MIIDGGSCANVASTTLVVKLSLPLLKSNSTSTLIVHQKIT
jgi:hypothetical protein